MVFPNTKGQKSPSEDPFSAFPGICATKAVRHLVLQLVFLSTPTVLTGNLHKGAAPNSDWQPWQPWQPNRLQLKSMLVCFALSRLNAPTIHFL